MNDSDAMLRSVRAAGASRWPTSACSPTAPPSNWWARDLPPGAPAGRRLRRCRHRCRLRGHQGRVPGHAQHRGAGRRAAGGALSSSTSSRASCKGETFVAITSGANMNFDRLRFVAERAEVGEQREAILRRHHPRGARQLRRFCSLVGPRAVTEFNYRISDGAGARLRRRGDRQRRTRPTHRAQLRAPRLPTLNLTDDEAGQAAPAPHGRRAQRAGADERPVPLHLPRAARRADALLAACTRAGTSACSTTATRAPTTAASWSASRYQADEAAFREFLETLAYPCVEETDNPCTAVPALTHNERRRSGLRHFRVGQSPA